MQEAFAGAAKEGLAPFFGNVGDLIMIDKTQAQMITALGRTRSPFHGVAAWPSLDEALAKRSREVLQQCGQETWADAGGVYGQDGKPTCTPMSLLAAEVVQSITRNPGGLLWTDADGIVWAVRLVPAAGVGGASVFGFALSWQGNGLGRPKKARHDLERVAGHLRLVGRAEQMLWYVHLAVLSQRSSVVLLPDVALGQLVWGGARSSWPQDWRADLFRTLKSLTALRSEVLRLSAAGWRPQLGAHSVAVAGVEQLGVLRPEQDYCRPCCALAGSGVRHSHFLVQVGIGFLGVLEKFRAGEDEVGTRVYNFTDRPGDERGRELKEAQKAGQLLSVSGPTALFGRSKWAALSEGGCRIIHGLIGEVTRVLGRNLSSRQDKAEVLVGSHVPGAKARLSVHCPLLHPQGRYVTFGGNGCRRGMGYLLAGTKGTGWLDKCGYPVPDDGRELTRVIRQFLRELRAVGTILGLTALGFRPATGDWYDLAHLLLLARQRQGGGLLADVHLRVYGPEDYLARCRRFFAQRGRFRTIPGADDPEPAATALSPGADLTVLIRRAGIRQAELAKHFGVSQQYVSQLMTHGRPWPEEYRGKATALIEQRIGAEGMTGKVG